MKIHDELRTLRLAAGLTPRQVAEAIGVGRTTYSYWESGKTIPPADKYKAAVDHLLEVARKR